MDVVVPAAVAPVRAVVAVKAVAQEVLLQKDAAVKVVGQADLPPKAVEVKVAPVVKAANALVDLSNSRE